MATAATHDAPIHDPWAAHYAQPSGLRHWPTEALVRFLAARGRCRDALEAGCGNGANLQILSRHAQRVFAVELSHAAMNHAALRALYDGDVARAVTFLHEDVRAMSAPNASVDLVVDCLTSQHLPWSQHEMAYREYRRVLRPGGALFLYHLTDRTSGGDRLNYDNASLALFPKAGLVCLPPVRGLVLALTGAGFHVEQVEGVERQYHDGRVAHYAAIAARLRQEAEQ